MSYLTKIYRFPILIIILIGWSGATFIDTILSILHFDKPLISSKEYIQEIKLIYQMWKKTDERKNNLF